MIIKYPDRIYHEFGLNSALYKRIIQRVKQNNPKVLIETIDTRKKVPFTIEGKLPNNRRNVEFWEKCKSSIILRDKQQRKEHGNMRFIHDFVAIDNIPGGREYIISMENGCPYNCRFCYLQGTLEETPVPTIFTNFQDAGVLLREIKIALLARYIFTHANLSNQFANRTDQDTIHRLIGLLNESIDQVKPNQSIEDIFKKYKKNIIANLKSTRIDKLKPFSGKLSSLKFPTSAMKYLFNCGELSDGLANDYLTDNSAFLLNLFSDPGIVDAGGYLVIRTKSDNISNLKSAKNTKNVVVSFSIGPPAYVEGCATLDERLEAARELLDSEYHVSLTLDPIIKHQNTEKVYKKILDDIKSKL
ncbi:MAG: hypothetical protein JXB49_26680, partial [Bacteroidales bacterium]|nr:hypothetical protein [Bacteroidales bacterium]